MDGAARRAVARVALYAALAVATWALLQPPTGEAPRFPHEDKVQHFALFAVLALLARAAHPDAAAWRVFAALVAYGLAVELAQPIAGRGAEALDLAADSAGALAAFARQARRRA